eukprot:1783654-Prymnesium_polylepis.1
MLQVSGPNPAIPAPAYLTGPGYSRRAPACASPLYASRRLIAPAVKGRATPDSLIGPRMLRIRGAAHMAVRVRLPGYSVTSDPRLTSPPSRATQAHE